MSSFQQVPVIVDSTLAATPAAENLAQYDTQTYGGRLVSSMPNSYPTTLLNGVGIGLAQTGFQQSSYLYNRPPYVTYADVIKSKIAQTLYDANNVPNMMVLGITPNLYTQGTLLTITGDRFVLPSGTINATGVGLLLLPNDGASFFSNNISVIDSTSLLFDVNSLVGTVSSSGQVFRYQDFLNNTFAVVVLNLNGIMTTVAEIPSFSMYYTIDN